MKRKIIMTVILLILCASWIAVCAKEEEVSTEELENQLNKNHYSEIKELEIYIESEGEEILASLSVAGPEFTPSYFNLDEAVKQYSEAILSENDYDDISKLVEKIKNGSDDWIVPVYDTNNRLCTFVVFRRGITLEQAETQNRWWPDKETKENYYKNVIRNEGKWNFEAGAINPPDTELNKYKVIFNKELLVKELTTNGIRKLKDISYIEFTNEAIKALLIDSGNEKKYYIFESPYSEVLEDGQIYSESIVLSEIKQMVKLRKEFAESGEFKIGGMFIGEKYGVTQYVFFGTLLIVVATTIILGYKRKKE